MSEQNNRPLRVVVCGSGFGTFYAEAVKRSAPDFELAGIVAHGSERSRNCASHYGVPLYTSVQEVPGDVDLACVAIRSSSLGGAGTDISMAFLERGVHVILEQPVHHTDLARCFRAAKKRNCCFMTGDLYVNMPEIRRFLQLCAWFRGQGQQMEFLRAGFCIQAFYPFAEILGELFPNSSPQELKIGEQAGDFKMITGRMGSTPFCFQFNNAMNPEDPDNYMQLLHSFSCFYPSGRLELVDTRGPLVWYPRLNMPWSILAQGGLPKRYPAHMNEKSVQILTPEEERIDRPYHEFVNEGWVHGIQADLYKLQNMTRNPSAFLVKAQGEQKSSRLWHELTGEFGYAQLNHNLQMVPVAAEKLEKAGILHGERKA